MLMRSIARAAAMLSVSALAVHAQQMPNPYGPPISLDNARKASTAALAEARKNNWNMAVAVVDPAGNLVVFEKLDNTQTASGNVAIGKARSSAIYKRPTKTFEDGLAQGGPGLRILGLEGAVPVEGGMPLLVNGQIVGGIGASGGTGQQDAAIAKAGADTVK